MFRYEVLFLTISEITEDESKNIQSLFSKIIQDAKADIISFERWGKYKLAYTIKRSEYGVYYLARFETNIENKAEVLKNIRNLLAIKLNNLILKYYIQKLPYGFLEYKRPASLEESSYEVNSLLKKNNGSESFNNDKLDIHDVEDKTVEIE